MLGIYPLEFVEIWNKNNGIIKNEIKNLLEYVVTDDEYSYYQFDIKEVK